MSPFGAELTSGSTAIAHRTHRLQPSLRVPVAVHGEFMERKSGEGPFEGVAEEPDGRDGKD